MSSSSNNDSNNPEWWDKVGPADFDGHTNFALMTPTERLIWLAQVQRFYWAAQEARRSITNNLVPERP